MQKLSKVLQQCSNLECYILSKILSKTCLCNLYFDISREQETDVCKFYMPRLSIHMLIFVVLKIIITVKHNYCSSGYQSDNKTNYMSNL